MPIFSFFMASKNCGSVIKALLPNPYLNTHRSKTHQEFKETNPNLS